MPDDAARPHLGARPAVGTQRLEQRELCGLRVGKDRKAADVGDVRRRDVHDAAKALDAVGGRVHVADADIADPQRLSAGLSGIVRQVHHPADDGLCRAKQGIGAVGRRGVMRIPAHDLGVEGLGGLHVRRDQFVPGEMAIEIDHLNFSRCTKQTQRSPNIASSLSRPLHMLNAWLAMASAGALL